VALTTAAIATGSYLLADVAWALSWLALCYAVVVACIARQQRQAIALGFITLFTANLVGLYLVPNRAPVMRLFTAAGYLVGSSGDIYEPDPASAGSFRSAQGMEPTIRTANAIGSLAVGLVGCLVGRLAYRHTSRKWQRD
jgi:hypothetical protein